LRGPLQGKKGERSDEEEREGEAGEENTVGGLLGALVMTMDRRATNNVDSN